MFTSIAHFAQDNKVTLEQYKGYTIAYNTIYGTVWAKIYKGTDLNKVEHITTLHKGKKFFRNDINGINVTKISRYIDKLEKGEL